ncbi:tetratricopeptide repeat protein [Achlya hypogyna]|uniref:Tetratricopeptide repeat protein n=1 Tax=Achlya hypogyna TaxID=1202772 RepID=A0A1V9ZEB9_ACHHY|nr:tetratricopeptide repeat protein [Achlya hypogyna]
MVANIKDKYAQYLLVSGRADEAAGFFTASVNACPHHSDLGYSYKPEVQPCLHTLVAYAFYLEHYVQDVRGAADIYERVLAVDPRHVLAIGNYAMLLHKLNTESSLRVEQAYEAAVEAYPRHGTVLCKYAGWLVQERRFALAGQYYVEATDAAPRSPDMLARQAGLASRRLGHYATFLTSIKRDDDNADAMYRRALDLHPSHAPNLSSYGFFLATVRQDFAAAQTMYKRSLSADPHDSHTWYNGLECFKMALQLDPTHFHSALHAARLCDADLADALRAEEYFRTAVELEAGGTDALVGYGQFLLRAQRSIEAEVMLEKAYAVTKDNVDLVRSLFDAKCLNMRRQSSPDRAVDDRVLEALFQQLVRLAPRDVGAVSRAALAVGQLLSIDPPMLYDAAARDPTLTVNALVAKGLYFEAIEGNDTEAETAYMLALQHDNLAFDAVFAFSKVSCHTSGELHTTWDDPVGAESVVRQGLAACAKAFEKKMLSSDAFARKKKQLEVLLQASKCKT